MSHTWPGHTLATRYPASMASQTGSTHVSYLARPYFSYKVPSKYGFSKFVTV